MIPAVAVVPRHSGRIRMREAGKEPDVASALWRNTKNASFERTEATDMHAVDPWPREETRASGNLRLTHRT